MSRVDGYEACRRIRSQPWGRGIVVVAQTGWGQEGDRRKPCDVGFDFHTVKSIDLHALAAMLVGLKAGMA